MSNLIRKAVSQNKIRLKSKRYDLDLSYITDQIIAMGFPSTGLESMYRNQVCVCVCV
jgi:phosphatidylinositol-3,4,5-trisphosphate 3-phosphatase/dual-specificity protein phosphatase PTEN